MIKRILTISIAVALILVLALPMAVGAADTSVTGSVAGTPTVTSVSPDDGDPGQPATLITITGIGFENTGDTLVTMSGPGLTITDSTYVDSTTVTFKLAIASGATATAGTRNVTVTQGGKSGTGTGIYTVNKAITVSAPSAINLGYMTAGTTVTGSSLTGSVTTNAATWSVNAVDAKATATGYMNTLENGTGTSLAAKFKIGKDAVTLVDASTTITYTQADTTPLVLELYVSQVVAPAAVAGSYQITITFTGSTS